MPDYTVTDPMSLLYLWIVDRIKNDIVLPEGVNILVTKDVGQLEVKERPSIAPKTVLISFENWDSEDMGDLAQRIFGDVVVKVTEPFYEILSAETPVDDREGTIKFIDLAHKVHKLLHGWTPGLSEESEIFGSMTRTKFGEDKRRPGLGVWVFRYSLSGEDYSTLRTKTKTAVGPSFTVQFHDSE